MRGLADSAAVFKTNFTCFQTSKLFSSSLSGRGNKQADGIPEAAHNLIYSLAAAACCKGFAASSLSWSLSQAQSFEQLWQASQKSQQKGASKKERSRNKTMKIVLGLNSGDES